MRLDKRGETEINRILFIIGIIGALLFFGFLLVTKANEFAETNTSLKINIAQDIQMMANTLAGVPGDAAVEYPLNVSQFNIILRKNSVSVSEEGDTSAEKVVRDFYLPQGYDAFGTLKGEDRLCMEKKDKKIILRRCTEEFKGTETSASKLTFYGLEILEDPVVFVIDHSKTMEAKSDWEFPAGVVSQGESKLDVAKWQLKSVLQGMEDGKKFNIVFFDSTTESLRPGLVELDADSRQEAYNFIDSFEPGTGTNTGEAVQSAIALGGLEAIYLLSDGQPDVVEVALAQIRNANAVKNVKINTIGVFTKITPEMSDVGKEIQEEENLKGREFLQQVAEESGGKFVTQE